MAHEARRQADIIYFTVTSDGTTGRTWLDCLYRNFCSVNERAKSVLCSPDFRPTHGITYEVAVLKGTMFSDNDRYQPNVRLEATRRRLGHPNAEVACLILRDFPDEDFELMGLRYIVAMHEPIKNSAGVPCLLAARSRGADSMRSLDVSRAEPNAFWFREASFAFVAQQIDSK